MKRLVDLLGASVALIVLSPLMLAVSIAIRLTSQGAVVFRQRRLGLRGGEPFDLYKFRSMLVNAPDRRNPDGSTYSGDDDARVTTVGQFIRKTSLDELPQLLNVLKGDMSLVGPRPDQVDQIRFYDETEKRKLLVRPGNSRLRTNFGPQRHPVWSMRKALDVRYVNEQSIALDFEILFKTIFMCYCEKESTRIFHGIFEPPRKEPEIGREDEVNMTKTNGEVVKTPWHLPPLRPSGQRFSPLLPSRKRMNLGLEEIDEVVDSLRSGWITTGPKVKKFEDQFAEYCGVSHAIAVNSCTAALHIALTALGVGPGDEVILPTLTFCSTANVVAHLGARPVVIDVGRNYQISVEGIERAITSRTKVIIPVHYAGQASDIDEINAIAQARNIAVVEDAAHAAGTEYKGRKIGAHGNIAAFSFYATKNMTTGEGGMITTSDADAATRMRRLALHGMSRDAWKRYTQAGSWYYEILEPGYKDNMTDLAAAIGIHQLRKLDRFNQRRQEMAQRYDRAFTPLGCFRLMKNRPDRTSRLSPFPSGLKSSQAAYRSTEIN